MPFTKKNKIWAGRKHSKETIAKMKSVTRTQKHKIQISNALRGTKRPGAGKNLDVFHVKGSGHPAWRGGVTPENIKLRRSAESILWRKSVFVRDNFTCQKYSTKGGSLVAHHINNFADYPELRFAIDNGITFSEKAHKKFHKKYGRKNNTIEQLIDFLK